MSLLMPQGAITIPILVIHPCIHLVIAVWLFHTFDYICIVEGLF